MLGDAVVSDVRDGEGPLAVAQPLVGLLSSSGEVAAAAAVTADVKALTRSPALSLTKLREKGGAWSVGCHMRGGRASSSFAVSIHQQVMWCERRDLNQWVEGRKMIGLETAWNDGYAIFRKQNRDPWFYSGQRLELSKYGKEYTCASQR
jgi:hypothetical protein